MLTTTSGSRLLERFRIRRRRSAIVGTANVYFFVNRMLNPGSETTSVTSSLLRGHIENGRKCGSLPTICDALLTREQIFHAARRLLVRIATQRRHHYLTLPRGPSDDQQFETMDAGHLFYLLMESEHDNPLFRSPLMSPTYILDIGTGTGTFAVDVADKFPDGQSAMDVSPGNPSTDFSSDRLRRRSVSSSHALGTTQLLFTSGRRSP